jgi:hypothetical protein
MPLVLHPAKTDNKGKREVCDLECQTSNPLALRREQKKEKRHIRKDQGGRLCRRGKITG